jgi:Spy/CpxP family protein refolding chaperone
MIKMLELNADQQKKLDDVFQQYRVRLIDHTAAVEREEAIMDQLMNAQPPEPAKIRAGIDRVADARGQLEKTKANMLLDMRLILTAEQWKALQERPAFGAKEYFKTPSPDAAPVPKPKR